MATRVEYGRVRKSDSVQVVLGGDDYEGERRLDLRFWKRGRPTRAGVSLTLEQWAELVPLLLEALESEGVA